MELHCGKPVIVEFNGLPGTGKTTTACQLKQMLNDGGIECADIFFYGKSLKKSRYANWISPSCWRLRNLLNNYIKTFDPSVDKYSRNDKFLQFFRGYRDFNKFRCGVLLKDQGLIQMLLSIAYLDKIGDTYQIERIAEFLDKRISFLRVDCAINPIISSHRIIKRKPSGSRLEKITSKDLTDAMNLQADNLEIIRSSFDKLALKNIQVIHLDTKDSVEKNAEILFQKILTMRNINA